MSQGPGSEQPGGYPPPGGYTPPPGYTPGAPQPTYQPPAPPPRRGVPWWGWLLGGCAGCTLVAVILAAVAGVGVFNFIQNATKDVGPVTPETVQQAFGEVPLYPGATLNTQATQGILVGVRVTEKGAGKQPGTMVKGAAILSTGDSTDKVYQYYDQELQAAGWQPASGQGGQQSAGGADQRVYRKGQEVVTISAQGDGSQTTITLMRVGPEMATQAPPASSP